MTLTAIRALDDQIAGLAAGLPVDGVAPAPVRSASVLIDDLCTGGRMADGGLAGARYALLTAADMPALRKLQAMKDFMTENTGARHDFEAWAKKWGRI